LAAAFKETVNRMLSGYLLRDVVDKLNQVDLGSPDDLRTMAHLYDSMLRELHDTARDSGKFFTPSTIIRFMIQQIDPQMGETILDPACGTGGFLAEVLDNLRAKAITGRQVRKLEVDLHGIEKSPLPYLLAITRMLLHGVKVPNIVLGDALAWSTSQTAIRDKVDVVMTNPPLGGSEKSTQTDSPGVTRTSSTVWLFLRLAIRKLEDGGRGGIVVPNYVLLGGGAGTEIKKDLLSTCNLHTVVRLPSGVLAPHTYIPVNLFFFEKTGRTKAVWYYEVLPPGGRKNYTKTKPLQFEELQDCQRWWGGASRTGRRTNERAWRVPIEDIEASGYDLGRQNPRSPGDLYKCPPEELYSEVLEKENEIINSIRRIGDHIEKNRLIQRHALTDSEKAELGWCKVKLGEVMVQTFEEHSVDPTRVYPNVGVSKFGRGLFKKPPIEGAATSYKWLYRIKTDQFIYSRHLAVEGAYALVTPEFDGYFVSSELPVFDLDQGTILPSLLEAYFRSPRVWEILAGAGKGLGAAYHRIHPSEILGHELWLPPLADQLCVVEEIEHIDRFRQLREDVNPLAGALELSALDLALAGVL
jgi:type I restriction enzyme M protein